VSYVGMVPGAGVEPARNKIPRDFKSLASTNFATQAIINRPRPESNRRKRLCRPLHDHSATQPCEWSGKRDSNSRPQPWQGCALPTELFPLSMIIITCFGPMSSLAMHFLSRLSSTTALMKQKHIKDIHLARIYRLKTFQGNNR
jgi:hypothetical protein